MYKDLTKNLTDFNLQLPKTIVPKPNETDYDNGFIRRYFIQKINDENGFIFEISEEEYNSYLQNHFWKTLDLKWRIKGPKLPVYDDFGNLKDMGVESSNKSSISIGSSKMKNVDLYLPNILQFHK
jgi:hypothetical protein